jgi:hypothetical protein
LSRLKIGIHRTIPGFGNLITRLTANSAPLVVRGVAGKIANSPGSDYVLACPGAYDGYANDGRYIFAIMLCPNGMVVSSKDHIYGDSGV